MPKRVVVGYGETSFGDLNENGDDQRPRVFEVSEFGGGFVVFLSRWYLGGSLGGMIEMIEDDVRIREVYGRSPRRGGECALHKNSS
jgi:hypothetical protein